MASKWFDRHRKLDVHPLVRILLFDGHVRNKSRDFISYCEQNSIISFRSPIFGTGI
jgi:hypothetical protein